MKKTTLYIFAQLTVFASFSQGIPKPFHISGDVKTIPDAEKIYLTFPEGADSALVVNGTFTFNGKIVTPTLSDLRIKYKGKPLNNNIYVNKDHISLFLSDGQNTIIAKNDQFNQSAISDAKWQLAYESYNEQILDVYKRSGLINNQYDAATSKVNVETIRTLRPKIDSLRKVETDFVCNYIKNNQSSPVTLFAIRRYGRPIVRSFDIEPAYNLLAPEFKASVEGKEFYKKIMDKKRFGTGVVLADFSQPDTTGKAVRLSDFRGKYVFIDLWASWCGPCRTQTPFVIKAAQHFKDKNFVVLAVSLDGSRSNWLTAIHKDNATGMVHVGDMKDRKNEVALLYDIHSIPQNFLLDPNGKVIARDLHELQLDNMLSTLFK